eukprot:1156784-Pelagomonas_calceolata.AAC.2
MSCTGAAAPAAEGGQCWCWGGRGSWLMRLRLVGVAGAPLAVAAVTPAAVAPAADCIGGGAGKAGACAAGLAAAAAAAAHGGGGLQSGCLSCCPSRPALRCRKGSPGLGRRPAGRTIQDNVLFVLKSVAITFVANPKLLWAPVSMIRWVST